MGQSTGEIILQNKNGRIMASSRDVAERFGKRHDAVLRDIDNLISDSTKLWNEMFIESSYISSRGKMYRCYDMNRDGFSLLAMGFTGKKALEWKLKYIEAFNLMEERLKSSNQLTEEEKLKLQLFSKDPLEVASAHNKLVELATAPLIAENEEMKPKAEYYEDVLHRDDLVSTTEIAKKIGMTATKLNSIMNKNHILFKQSGVWMPYHDYSWLINDGYADYDIYRNENAKQRLKWTEKGRKWIFDNYKNWIENCNR